MSLTIKRLRVSVRLKPILSLLTFFFLLTSVSYSQTQTQKAVYANISTYIKGYYESLPVDYNTNTTKKYPLLIFLHGAGERGNGTTQLPLVLKWGPPRLINEGKFPSSFTVGGKNYSFIVISPQYSSSSDYVTAIHSLINHCKTKYRVDETKIYLTGLSMGGLLTFNFCGSSQKNSELFAAILTVCGGGVPTEGRINNIANGKLPVWVTNNSGDPYNPASRAEETVTLLNAHVPAPPKAILTIFQKSGHDAWTPTYDPNFRQGGLSVYEWMLSYSRGAQATPAPAPPVAEAGTNQTITLPTSSVTLDASKSTAASGYTIKTYAWSKVSGPTGGTITTVSGKTTTVTGLVAGTYVFQLKVTDSNGTTDTDTVTIVVNPAVTTPPVSSAGADQTITLPTSSVTLDGSKSTAATGYTISTYAWSKVSGPSGGTITTVSGKTTTVTALIAGTYVFQLKVTDSKGATATDNISINVKAATTTPPVANAGADQTVTLPITSITLDGSKSTPPTGYTLSTYAWSKVSGPTGGTITTIAGKTTTVTALIAGSYVFQLKVTDSKGTTATDNVTIVVNAAPITVALAANAGTDQTITMPTKTATLNGTKSTAATGYSIKSYAWSKVSGPGQSGDISAATASTTSIIDLVPGTYVYKLTITDNAGKTATDNITLTVKYINGTLKANAGADQTVTYPLKQQLIFDGSASTAPSGSKITCSWTRLSGPGSYGAVLYPSVNLVTTTSKSLVPGVYQYQLTVRDENRNTSTDVVVITVKEAVSSRISSSSTQEQSVNGSIINNDVTVTQEKALKVKINPNPVTSDMTVWIDGTATGKTNILVYNLQGALLFQQSFTRDAYNVTGKSFNVSHLPAGIYLVKVVVDNKIASSTQMIKQ